jgi:hypothetical protein
MKKLDINALAQLSGLTGVMASLIFVGFELRQSQKIALAGQMQSRAEQITDYNLTFLETADSDDLYAIFNENYSELTEKQKWLSDVQGRWQLQMQQTSVWMYQQGFLSEDRWLPTKTRIQGLYDNCERRHLFDSALETAYQNFLNTIPDNCLR